MKRWVRYGKDRLYVSDGSGRSLGYLDNATGLVHVNDEHDRSAVSGAVGVDVPEQRAARPASPEAAGSPLEAHASPAELPASPHDPYAVTVERLAVDLGENRPGAGARAIAEQHRSEAPVRTLLARALGVHTDERAWRVGAKGEETVAKELRKLGESWTVVHDIPVGDRGANIDHIVIRPAGVFTVNSKWHVGKTIWAGGDTVMINGHREPYVRNAPHEAKRACRLLSDALGAHVPVVGIVAVLAQEWKVKEQPSGGAVLVLRPGLARRHLQKLPTRYARPELERLVHQVRRSTTWQP